MPSSVAAYTHPTTVRSFKGAPGPCLTTQFTHTTTHKKGRARLGQGGKPRGTTSPSNTGERRAGAAIAVASAKESERKCVYGRSRRSACARPPSRSSRGHHGTPRGSSPACCTAEACLRHLRCPRALSLGGDALLAPECAVAVRVAMRWVAAPPMAALGHARVADEAVAIRASRLVAIDGRRDQPLGRMEGVERAERPLVRQVLVLVWTVFLRYLDVSLPYLTVSPRISLHLLASPRISPYLPVSARISYLLVSPGISRYLPVSPGIPPYPAISRHIPPRIPRKKPSTPGMKKVTGR